MAQVADTNEYENIRWGFRQKTLDFLSRLQEALHPLKGEFVMVLGDICCGSCAAYEAGTECEKNDAPYYMYWSIQDEESLDSAGDIIYIGYGGKNGTEAEAIKAAQSIVILLRHEDYEVEWDGSTGTRISVKADLGRDDRPNPAWDYDC